MVSYLLFHQCYGGALCCETPRVGEIWSLCVLWWKNRAVGSDTVEMTGQSDVSDSHGTADTVERDSGGKVLKFHSRSVCVGVICIVSFVFSCGFRCSQPEWKGYSLKCEPTGTMLSLKKKTVSHRLQSDEAFYFVICHCHFVIACCMGV